MADPRDIPDLQLADAIVADGFAAEHLPAALRRPVEHVPKGVDVSIFRPDGPNRRAALGLEGRRVALVASRLVPIKNVALAIDAMSIAARACPNLRLLVVGDGPLRAALESRVATLGLTEQVIFAGRVDHGAMPEWYRSVDLFVLPSEFDNSPNVVLEAMASGLPVVATDVGGVRQYMQHGVNGSLVPAGDAAALSDAIARYADDRDLSAQVGLRNRDDVVAGFSWAQSARVLRSLYDRVIARGSESPAYRASA
jgi:glycosyltransferase involved in cell wall biosynthesis